ncbi:MAG: hypothetical protein MZV70_28950 [Desulfobacterales bacterium]|nr:hypothetical protein [Desulfobacterales bacterium]
MTVFLAGLLPGALWGRRLAARGRRVLILSDMALIGLLGATFAAVHAGDRLGQAFYLFLGFRGFIRLRHAGPGGIAVAGGRRPRGHRRFFQRT